MTPSCRTGLCVIDIADLLSHYNFTSRELKTFNSWRTFSTHNSSQILSHCPKFSFCTTPCYNSLFLAIPQPENWNKVLWQETVQKLNLEQWLMECEGLWVETVLQELKVFKSPLVQLYCDNKSAISIAHNLVLHYRTKLGIKMEFSAS